MGGGESTAPADGLQLRAYTAGDLDAIAALDAVCFQPPFRFSKAAMREFAEAPNAVVRLAYLGDRVSLREQLAGFCIMHLEGKLKGPKLGYIVTLDVAGPYRGQGIGNILMRAVEGAAMEAKAKEMTLHVSVHNGAAIRLYERLGYERMRSETNFYGAGGDALVYRRRLPEAHGASV